MKKLLALFMAMLILLSLAACGEDPAPAATEPTADTTFAATAEKENNLFSHGLLAVRTGGQWGYINEKGEMVIQPIYDMANTFYDDGYASVTLDDQKGVINEKGEFVIPAIYELFM